MRRASFYNINNADQQLINFEAAALSQEDLVIEAFHKAKCPMAWFEIKAMIDFDIDECSLKRATSSLTQDHTAKDGQIIRLAILIKTQEMVTGPKGKPCHKYKLKDVQ